MTRRDKKTQNRSRHYSERLFLPLILLFATLSMIIIAILIVDIFDLSEKLNIHLRFDWAMILCTFSAAIASVILGIVSIKQNTRLAKINDAQLEHSIIAQNYPLIKFCSNQIIEVDNDIFKLKFYDTRNTPLREIYVGNMRLIPYSEAYKVEEGCEPIWAQKAKQRLEVEFTPYHKKNDVSDGFYFADIQSDPELFQKHEYYRIEFELDVVSTAGVVTIYDYKILVRRSDETNESKSRRYPEVYHQFYSLKNIMSLKEYVARSQHLS